MPVIRQFVRPFALLAAASAVALSVAGAPAGAAAGAPRTAPRSRAELPGAVQSAISATGLKKATIGVSVRDASSGAPLVDIAGSTALIPASNMKVLTTGAALHTLGADYFFRTRLMRDGDRLTVVGDGDPSFGDPDLLALMVFKDARGNVQTGLTADALLDLWVDAVRRAGVTQVKELVVDDRVFDREFVHPQWPADQLANSYCAQVSGLAFHTNLLRAYLGQSGGRAEVVRWSPSSPWLQVRNKSTASNSKKDDQTIGIGRTDDPAVMTLTGNMKAVPIEPIAVCVDNMPAYFGRLLAERLRGAGVQVGSIRLATAADAAPGGTVVGPVIQTPLKSVVKQCNTESQNMYAEALLKRIGRARSNQPGSWTNGAAALALAVDERLGAGAAAAGLKVADGSGLSRGNRVSANLLTAWLKALTVDDALRDEFIQSLAVAGETGTVSKRFKGLDTSKITVHCKTGFINGVSCLTGYVGLAGQPPRYAFSVLCNDLTEANAVGKAKDLQEKIVRLLAETL